MAGTKSTKHGINCMLLLPFISRCIKPQRGQSGEALVRSSDAEQRAKPGQCGIQGMVILDYSPALCGECRGAQCRICMRTRLMRRRTTEA